MSKFKWQLIITSSPIDFGVGIYTYKKDIGYIFEGVLLSIKDAIDYFKFYIKLLDSNPEMRYKLSGYKIYSRPKQKILKIIV